MQNMGRSGIGAILVTCWLAAFSPAQALVIGAGQSVTIDFDFSAFDAAITAGAQPLTLSFEGTTSLLDPFTANIRYSAFGELSLGAILFNASTVDIIGSLRLSPLTESIDLIDISFSVQDNNGVEIVALTSFELPESVDVQIPEPGTLPIIGDVVLGLGCLRKRT
jgi:hypothetical protein